MRLLLDETLPDELAQRLALQHHDVATVSTHPELRGAPDSEVFAIARREHRVIVTTDAMDFLELAAGQDEHARIVVTSVRRVAREQALAQLVRDLQQIVGELERGPARAHLLP